MTIKEISGKDLEKLDDSYKIIDVRTKEEYKEGHIKNAINIPLDRIEANDFNLNKNEKLVIHCRTNVRSRRAIEILMKLGYKDLSLSPGVALFDYDLVK